MKKGRRIFSIMLAFMMLLGMMPVSVFATETKYSVRVYTTDGFTDTTTEAGGTISGAGDYKAGDTVTLTGTPENGYCAMRWAAAENAVTLPSGTSSDYFQVTFTMPARDVIITGTFIAHNYVMEDKGDGTHVETCYYCGVTKDSAKGHYDTNGDSFCDVCGAEVHIHAFSPQWTKGTVSHWHACACGVKKDIADHVSSGAATVDKAEVCTVCGYEIASKIPSYTVILDGNGGTGNNVTIDKVKSKYTLPANTFTRAGYMFLGWNTNKNATSGNLQPGDTYSVTADTRFYAIWKSLIGVQFDYESLRYEITGTDDAGSDKNTVKVVDGAGNTKPEGQVMIPEKVSFQGAEYIVSKIGEGAFYACHTLESVKVSDSVVEIEDDAFSRCNGLKEITLSKSLTTIGDGVFFDCQSLEVLVIPDTVTEIGNDAFSTCIGLKEITLPKSLKKIETSLLYRCHSLETIEIPSGVTEIGEGAFFSCVKLEKVLLHNGIEIIGNNAFEGCDSLKEIHIPHTVKEIKDKAFWILDFETIYIYYIGDAATVTLGADVFPSDVNVVYVSTIQSPTNLRWEGNVAKWDPVEGAEQYQIKIYAEAFGFHIVNKTLEANVTSFDLGATSFSADSEVYFIVRAIAGDKSSMEAMSVSTYFTEDSFSLRINHQPSAGILVDGAILISGGNLEPESVSNVDMTGMSTAKDLVIHAGLINANKEFEIHTGQGLEVVYSLDALKGVLLEAGGDRNLRVETELMTNEGDVTIDVPSTALRLGETAVSMFEINTYVEDEQGGVTYIPVEGQMLFRMPVTTDSIPDNGRLECYRINDDASRSLMVTRTLEDGIIEIQTDGNSRYIVVYVQNDASNSWMIVLGVVAFLALAGGGFALYWFKFRKKTTA